MDVARSQLARKDVAHRRLGRAFRKRVIQHAQIAPRPRNPGHVVQADVGIRLLRESLDEQQLVEPQQRIGEGQLAHGSPSSEIELAIASPARRCSGSCASCVPNAFDFGFKRCGVESHLVQIGRQPPASLHHVPGRQGERIIVTRAV